MLGAMSEPSKEGKELAEVGSSSCSALPCESPRGSFPSPVVSSALAPSAATRSCLDPLAGLETWCLEGETPLLYWDADHHQEEDVGALPTISKILKGV